MNFCEIEVQSLREFHLKASTCTCEYMLGF